MGLPARDTIIAHKLSFRISIGCVNKVHPLLVCPVCDSGGRGCSRDSVIQVVLCIIIVPGLMIKDNPPPPPPPPSLKLAYGLRSTKMPMVVTLAGKCVWHSLSNAWRETILKAFWKSIFRVTKSSSFQCL